MTYSTGITTAKGALMYQLVVDRADGSDVTRHRSRELAHTALLTAAAHHGYHCRTFDARWTHTRYILYRVGTSDPIGRAAITELCRCQHSIVDHDAAGCIGTDDELRSPCLCDEYAPEPPDPALFDIAEVIATPGPA